MKKTESHTDPHLTFASFFPDTLKAAACQLSLHLSEGHICIDLENRSRTNTTRTSDDNLSPWYTSEITPKDLENKQYVARSPQVEFPDKPFILDETRLYLQRYWVYETKIIESVCRFVSHAQELRESNAKRLLEHVDFVKKIFPTMDNSIIDWQLAAAVTAVLNTFSIITGGPGTGKTYTVSKLLAILLKLNKNESIVMCAPTGKAASRLKDSLNDKITDFAFDPKIQKSLSAIDAKTIHSLLGYRPGTHRFKHTIDHPLEFSTVIVDEASMIDAALMSKLLDAVRPDARIILLGDKNQLASVEAGSIFGDLCRAGQGKKDGTFDIHPQTIRIYNAVKGSDLSEPKFRYTTPLAGTITELKVSHRFKDNEGIGRFSKGVIGGKRTVLSDKEFLKEGSKVLILDSEKKIDRYFDLYRKYIDAKEIKTALEYFNFFRVLCATRHGPLSVEDMNTRIEQHLGLNPANQLFYHNQPVMITHNDHQLKLYNGDIGLIRKMEDGRFFFFLNDHDPVPAAVLPPHETAYALTIHKSQGSDYNTVLICLPSDSTRILSRELLYTAVTRAKTSAVLAASMPVLEQAVMVSVERASGIEKRLAQKQGAGNGN